MVQEGHAWAYRDYMKDPQYCYSEADARARRLGLWSLPSTSTYAPWEWRAHQRDASKGFTDYSRETAANCIAAMHGRRAATAECDAADAPSGAVRTDDRLPHQGEHQPERPDLPRAGEPLVRADEDRRVQGRAMVLHRGGGAGGRLEGTALMIKCPNGDLIG